MLIILMIDVVLCREKMEPAGGIKPTVSRVAACHLKSLGYAGSFLKGTEARGILTPTVILGFRSTPGIANILVRIV